MFNASDIRITERNITISELLELKYEIYSKNYFPSILFGTRVIENILCRIPIGTLWIDRLEIENLKIIDGIKRFLSIKNFVDNIFSLRGLECFNIFEGYFFNDIPGNLRRRINETYININYIDPGTSEEAKNYIIKCIN